jgi:hypothetical protein
MLQIAAAYCTRIANLSWRSETKVSVTIEESRAILRVKR